jgi:hypothetical protein
VALALLGYGGGAVVVVVVAAVVAVCGADCLWQISTCIDARALAHARGKKKNDG